MKRILLLAVFAVAFLSHVTAQKHEPWDIFITPKAGVAYTGFTSQNCEFRPGFIGGASVEVFFFPHFALDTELTFSMEGANKVDSDIDNRDYNYNLNFINTDYLFKWYIGNHFNVFTGLHLGRIVWAKADGVKIKNELRRGTFAFPAGIGLDLGNWTIDARFNYSFYKIAKTDLAKQVLQNAAMMGGFVTIGYKIQVF